jgi:hypothetical protein
MSTFVHFKIEGFIPSTSLMIEQIMHFDLWCASVLHVATKSTEMVDDSICEPRYAKHLVAWLLHVEEFQARI